MNRTRALVVVGLILSVAGAAHAQPSTGRVRGISGAVSGEKPGDALTSRPANAPTGGAAATTPAGGAATTPTPTTPRPQQRPLLPNEERYSDSVIIRGDPAFRAGVKADLDRLRRTRVGGAVLSALDAAGHPVYIAFGPNHAEPTTPKDAYAAAVTTQGNRVVVERPAAGSGTTVRLRRTDEPCFPNLTTLNHELIHALHNAQGRNVREHDYRGVDASTDNHEEARAIGIGAYAQEQLTDNALRRELGIPLRSGHAGSCGARH